MTSFPWPPEQVTRHRGGVRDENGEIIPATDTPLTAIGVAPGIYPAPSAQETISKGRDSENIGAVVYFTLGTDVVNSDELTVRGERYRIVVNEWRMRDRGGLEVVCSRGQG